MASDPPAGQVLLDLEKELVCSVSHPRPAANSDKPSSPVPWMISLLIHQSDKVGTNLTYQICTEVLYQPLTLLDCLHTFCGSCLKEWFSAQSDRRRSSSSSPRFTCPGCRAVVRETRPNATVTTLLDMFLAANPSRVKSTAEKEEIAQKYKPGDSVFPSRSSRDHSDAETDEDDRRLLDEVRELSLRDGRTRTGQAHRAGNSSRSHRTERVDAGGSRENGRSRQSHQRALLQAEDGPTRQIEHQSSLRSLLSLPDAESIEEQILQQIVEEGLLDGIDLNNLGPTQEEELSERIAEAYRRRYRHRSRSQQRREMRERAQESRTRTRAHSAQRLTTPHEPSETRSGTLGLPGSNYDPSSRRRRLSDQGSRRRQSPVRTNQASSSDDVLRPASRSASDVVSERARASTTARGRSRPLNNPRTRRATESEGDLTSVAAGGQTSQRHNGLSTEPTTASSPLVNVRRPSLASTEQNPLGLTSTSVSTLVPAPLNPNRSRPSSSRSNVSQSSSSLYVEPSVSCDRCGTPSIQYDLYKNCTRCKNGKYNLCLRCYRLGRGCLRWSGFGPSAQAHFDKVLASSNNRSVPREVPHILRSLQYSRPPETARRSMSDGKQMIDDDPSRRLRTGFFCDICQSPANDCYWKCGQCNEGDWGFCNRCVNQGKCCIHPLLPICRLSKDVSNPPLTPVNASSDTSTPRVSASSEEESFKILSFSTNCDICTYPIPASTTRFHCLECNHGDYDVCMNCYLKLVATNKIAKENGHNGWRRCLKGHRMVVIGFEDNDHGQRRLIVRDLVGGRALKDEHLPNTASAISSPEVGSGDWSWKEGPERRKKASRARITSLNSTQSNNSPESSPSTPVQPSFPPRFPPDGGVGLIVHALWSWYPEDDVQDELSFPRGADITEAENINDDWFWGCYAGRTGLFPGALVTVVGEVV